MGISEEDQKHLFTRFFRSTAATEQAIQGTGLGLSIVHAIVTQHGGAVSVDSARRAGVRRSRCCCPTAPRARHVRDKTQGVCNRRTHTFCGFEATER